MKKASFIRLIILNLFIVNYCFAQVTNIAEDFPYKVGNLRFNTSQMYFPKILNTETKTDTLKIYNEWNNEMELSFNSLPEFIICKASPEILKPQETGKIIVTYIGSKRNAWGFIHDRISLTTNDEDQPVKQFNTSVNIIEDFSGLSKEDLANAPKIEFLNTKHDFGTVTQGSKVECKFEFKNEGKKDLIIRQAKPSCGCTASLPEKKILKPGETSYITAIFNTTGRNGNQFKSITVVSNDPLNSIIHLHLSSIVE